MKWNTSKKLIIFVLILMNMINFHAFAITTENSDDKKVIYLTFDDGPAGKVTKDVLDILKKESVPATFFLIGEQIKGQEALVKRMHKEGHSLGLHSMTHEMRNLYCSNESFLKEMLDTQETIYQVVGIKPNIIRFPFGCNNTNYRISESMVDLLHRNNLKIYDWNADSTDGAYPHSSPSRFINNAKSDKNRVVLLMHCAYMSKNSVKALPSIIKYYKDNGYEFKSITEDTPEEFHFKRK